MAFHFFECEITFFFFQAEDGIRDSSVTGVQTCALPILSNREATDAMPAGSEGPRGGGAAFGWHGVGCFPVRHGASMQRMAGGIGLAEITKIGRASCRERG